MPYNNVMFSMSMPPYWHCGRTLLRSSLHMLAALVPAMVMALWYWGLPAASVMILGGATAVLTEALWCRVMGRKSTVGDCTALISGLLLAFLLPAHAPWWLVLIGAFVAISLGKMAFGGLGANPVNTTLVGWAVLYVSFPLFLDSNAMQLATNFVDPLVRLKYFGAAKAAEIPLLDLLMGHQINGLGAGQVGALLLGGLFLVVRGIVRWPVALGFLLGMSILTLLFNLIDPATAISPLFHICTGSSVLGAFFLATEMGNSPVRILPMFFYGLIAGGLTMCIRHYGSNLDGVPFAILLANMLTPWFDSIRRTPFGGRKS